MKHGQSDATKEYIAWKAMKQRCYDPNFKSFDAYGGRGIKVYRHWKNSFIKFFEDVGRAPSALHSLDRYPNNDGNYEPGNVRWATPKQQNNNRRKRRFYCKPDGEDE